MSNIIFSTGPPRGSEFPSEVCIHAMVGGFVGDDPVIVKAKRDVWRDRNIEANFDHGGIVGERSAGDAERRATLKREDRGGRDIAGGVAPTERGASSRLRRAGDLVTSANRGRGLVDRWYFESNKYSGRDSHPSSVVVVLQRTSCDA
jgi:hypothetical protein